MHNLIDSPKHAEFKILLRYLEGLQGNQRGLAVACAQQILEEGEGKTEDGGEAMSSWL